MNIQYAGVPAMPKMHEVSKGVGVDVVTGGGRYECELRLNSRDNFVERNFIEHNNYLCLRYIFGGQGVDVFNKELCGYGIDDTLVVSQDALDKLVDESKYDRTVRATRKEGGFGVVFRDGPAYTYKAMENGNQYLLKYIVFPDGWRTSFEWNDGGDVPRLSSANTGDHECCIFRWNANGIEKVLMNIPSGTEEGEKCEFKVEYANNHIEIITAENDTATFTLEGKEINRIKLRAKRLPLSDGAVSHELSLTKTDGKITSCEIESHSFDGSVAKSSVIFDYAEVGGHIQTKVRSVGGSQDKKAALNSREVIYYDGVAGSESGASGLDGVDQSSSADFNELWSKRIIPPSV